MRALLLCLDYPPGIGGIQTMLASIAAELGDWDLTVVAPDIAGASEWDRTQPYRVRRVRALGPGRGARRYLPGMVHAALCEVSARRPDVLLCGHPTLGALAAAIFKLARVPYVVFTYAMELRHPGLQRMLRWSFEHASRVLTISRSGTSEVLKLGCPESKVRQIPLGFSSARFEGVAPSDLPVRLGLEGVPWLLTVTRLDEHYKGVDMILRALPLLKRQIPEVRYVVAGDGLLRAYLERLAHSLGCADHVHFVGRVSEADLSALYRGCTAFVLMSRDDDLAGGAEGFGLVCLEANSFAKPVLGGNSGGIPDAVLDGCTGLLANPEDPLHISTQASRLLNDPVFCRLLGQTGKGRVDQELTWATTATRLREIVGEVASGHG